MYQKWMQNTKSQTHMLQFIVLSVCCILYALYSYMCIMFNDNNAVIHTMVCIFVERKGILVLCCTYLTPRRLDILAICAGH